MIGVARAVALWLADNAQSKAAEDQRASDASGRAERVLADPPEHLRGLRSDLHDALRVVTTNLDIGPTRGKV